MFSNRFSSKAAVFAVSALSFGLSSPAAIAFTFNLQTATIADINRAFDLGGLNSVGLTQLYLARIAAYDTTLNSIITLNPNALTTAAGLDLERQTTGPRSPLHGVPILLKDNIDTFDMPTTAGFLGLANSTPPNDSFLTRQLREAGAIILGKTSLTEFANFLTNGMPAGYSSLNGYTFNPYNPVTFPPNSVPAINNDGRPLLSPGGSSAGSGAAMAAVFAAAAIGTETSGSILSPSNQNSLVGIKPTVGLISRDGVIPIAASQDTAGPMTRSVTDAAIFLGALTGLDPTDPAMSDPNRVAYTDYTQFLDPNALAGKRIGVPQNLLNNLNDGQRAIINAAIAVMERLGATMVYQNLSTTNPPGTPNSTVLSYEFKRDLNAYLASLGPSSPIQDIDDVSDFITNYNLANFGNANPGIGPFKYGQTSVNTSKNRDITPGSADTIRYLSDRANDLLYSRDRIDAYMLDNTLDTILFPGTTGAGIAARAGYPSIIVPAGYLSNPSAPPSSTNPSPYGIMFTGRAYSEASLIGYAYAYEQASRIRVGPASTPALPGEEIAIPEPSMVPALGALFLGGTILKFAQKARR